MTEANAAAMAECFNAAAQNYESDVRKRRYFASEWIGNHIQDLGECPECRILDLACGPGLNVRTLRDRRPGILADGVDVASKMIDLARATGTYHKLYVHDLHRELQDISSDTYDLVIGFGFLEFLDDVTVSLSECHRVLKGGAQLWISFARFEADDEASPPRHATVGGRVLTGYSAAEILHLMGECKMRVIGLDPIIGYITRAGFPRPYYVVRAQKT